MWCLVVLVLTDFPEESIASIFRVEKSARRNQRQQVDVPPKHRCREDLNGATYQKIHV
jgi:hypothetical protein